MCQRLLTILAVCATALLSCSAVLAQQSRRVALTVGNADYGSFGTLQGSDRDARRVADALTRLGFEVISVADADRDAMLRAIGDFRRSATGADIAVAFLSGYGVRLRNQPHLVPVDVTLKNGVVADREIIRLAEVVGALGQARNSVLLVDTCGSESLGAPQVPGMTPGLGRLEFAAELVAATASSREVGCEPRRLLADSFLIDLEQPGLDVRQLIRRTRNIVDQRSGGDQELAIWSLGARPFTLAAEDTASAALRRLGPEPALPALRAYEDKYRDQNAEVVRVLARDREQQQVRPDADQVAKAWNRWLDDAWLRKREEEARIARREALEGRFSREAEPPPVAVAFAPPPSPLAPPVPPLLGTPTPAPTPPAPEPSVPLKSVPPELPPVMGTPAPRPPTLPKSVPVDQPPASGPPAPAAPPPPPSLGAPAPEAPSPPASVPLLPPAAPELGSEPKASTGKSGDVEEPRGSEPPRKTDGPPDTREAKLVEPKPFNPTAHESKFALQQELKRLNCLYGKPDGAIGPDTIAAIEGVIKKLGNDPGLRQLTEAGLNALKNSKAPLCPQPPWSPPSPPPVPPTTREVTPAPSQSTPPTPPTPTPLTPTPPAPAPAPKKPDLYLKT